QIGLTHCREVFGLFSGRGAWRRAETGLSKLLKNRKCSGVAFLRIENLCFREEKDLTIRDREFTHEGPVEYLKRFLVFTEDTIDINQILRRCLFHSRRSIFPNVR